jgi:hypothetical protein
VDLFGLDRVEISEHDILRGAVLGLTGAGEAQGHSRGE